MIRITRTICPELLGKAYTEENLYRAKPVVGALYEMQHGKCCYCEGEIPKTGPEKTVEHFRPKERKEFKGLRNNWENLLLACLGCNGNKSDSFPVDEHNQPLIIDPTDTSVNPEEHLEFIVSSQDEELYGLIIERNHSALGRTTIDTLKLDSKSLKIFRAELIYQLLGYYNDMLIAFLRDDIAAAEYAKARLINCTEPTKRFSACAKEFVEKMRVDEKYNKWLVARTNI